MLELLPAFRQHFDSLQDRLTCFCDMGIQVEGWFKGELLALLGSLRTQGLVIDFDREVKSHGRKIDLAVTTKTEFHWIELKHWLVGRQKGSKWGPGNYFIDRSSIGIVGDVDKLLTVTLPGQLWLLMLLTANPGNEAWREGVDKFNSKFSPRRVKSLTTPSDFPASYFIGMLELCRS
jgi:hypothetical protein